MSRLGTTRSFLNALNEPFGRMPEPSKLNTQGRQAARERGPEWNFKVVENPEYGENCQSQKLKSSFLNDLRVILADLPLDLSQPDLTAISIKINIKAQARRIKIQCQAFYQRLLFHYRYGSGESFGAYYVSLGRLKEIKEHKPHGKN